jgi:hypothetical protein
MPKKGHKAWTCPGNHSADPGEGLITPLESQTLSVTEETKRKDKVKRFLAEANSRSHEVSRPLCLRGLKGRCVLGGLALEMLVVVLIGHWAPVFQYL